MVFRGEMATTHDVVVAEISFRFQSPRGHVILRVIILDDLQPGQNMNFRLRGFRESTM